MSEKTIFEKVVAREVPGTFLYEDGVCAVIKNINPVAPVHYLAIPKKPYPAIDKLAEEELFIVDHLIKATQQVLQEESVSNFKLVFNGGKYLHIPEHLHLHVLGGDDLED